MKIMRRVRTLWNPESARHPAYVRGVGPAEPFAPRRGPAIALERRPEAELCGARLERDIRVVLRLPIVCGRFIGDKRVVVRMVEHVEDLRDPVQRYAAVQPETLLDAHVHPM